MSYNLPENSAGGDQYRNSALGWEVWCWERIDCCNDHIWPSQCPASSCMESGPGKLNNIDKENLKLNLNSSIYGNATTIYY